RVFLHQQPNGTSSNMYPGCPVTLGYRVQYSDMAMLRWVQLQWLNGVNNDILVENIDNTTRTEWSDNRGKNITWTVPSTWAPGDYVLRAFGNASYACTDQEGHRTTCSFPLEDRETLHLLPLAASQGCPSLSTPVTSSSPSTIFPENRVESVLETSSNLSTNSNKNMSEPTMESRILKETSNATKVDHMQQETIRSVMAKAKDVNLANCTVTWANGTTTRMADLMDEHTVARLVATMEQSEKNSGVNTTTLLEQLHNNSTALVLAPMVTMITSTDNGTAIMPDGRGFVLEGVNGTTITTAPNSTFGESIGKNLNQIQDKTSKNKVNSATLSPLRMEVMVTGMVIVFGQVAAWLL
ncbi:hypothetical protein BG004_006020, partial [Podila humilis]